MPTSTERSRSTDQANIEKSFSDHPTTAKANRSFLADVRIDYGPSDLLGRFFIAADAALEQQGITLSFATFQELLAANEANPESWLPLNPTFRPNNGIVGGPNSFALLGRNRQGNVVTAQAVQIFEWQNSTFKAEAESLRLLFAQPDPNQYPQGTLTMTAPSAHSILKGRIGYGGAAWRHPTTRGKGLSPILGRISKAYACAHWQIDHFVGITSLALLATGFTKEAGFKHSEPGVSFADPTLGPPQAAITWITADEILDDLESYMKSVRASSVPPTQLRHA